MSMPEPAPEHASPRSLGPRRGRPSKLNPVRQEVLCAEIRLGHPFTVACAMAGIDYSTFREWIVRGTKRGTGPYYDFAVAVQKAEAEGERAAIELVRKHARLDPTTARWVLERRYRAGWAPRLEPEDGQPALVQATSVIVNVVSPVPRGERPADRPLPLAERVRERSQAPEPQPEEVVHHVPPARPDL